MLDPILTTGASGVDGLRILLVEDDDGDALLVEEHLLSSDLRVDLTRVRTLAEAQRRSALPIDCVLLDLALPDASGLDAIAAILADFDAPVVVLTGMLDRHLGVEAVAAGAEDYLAKDEVDGRLIERSIRYAVERHRAKDTSRRLLEEALRRSENLRLERGLLPRCVLDDPTLFATTRYRAGGDARVLGGDFFDAIELSDGTVRAVIGDVCGHGPDEAALGVNLRIGWRTLVLAGTLEDAVLPTLERLLYLERDNDAFVTVCDVSVDPDRASLRYRVAGHPAPLLLTDRLEELPVPTRGLPLGLWTEATWITHEVPLPADWSLLLYTDGLIEAREGGGTERVGPDGLRTLFESLLDLDDGPRLDELIERVRRKHGGPLDDDVALLHLRHRGAGG
ncbi:MAG: serine/threonine protein phosphatase [Actinomycetia bacterium]|nr:serine/threonine protein phosphatase [Actinomycetes bacterium]